jgi:8-oxo-dGTP pyrophosphatase MutT (NUDIX family)
MNKKKFSNNLCTNCNSSSHDYKKCQEPITSWGIILVKKTGHNLKHENCNLQTNEDQIGIKLNNINDFRIMSCISNQITFLLVRRKHSLGYTEFIRGKYVTDNIMVIQDLFKQMTPAEIETIKQNEHNFDILWNEFWGNMPNKLKLNDYQEAKKKFILLRDKINVELPLSFYTSNTKTMYIRPEWGFPKGRKHPKESDKDCAVREFCEETGLDKSDFNVLDEINPIVENMTGTNGIAYRHIYYLAEGITNTIPQIVSNEIGEIGYFTAEQAFSIFRDYHVEKKNIITIIGLYFTNKIMNAMNNNT